jgi:hypothetical protein
VGGTAEPVSGAMVGSDKNAKRPKARMVRTRDAKSIEKFGFCNPVLIDDAK